MERIGRFYLVRNRFIIGIECMLKIKIEILGMSLFLGLLSSCGGIHNYAPTTAQSPLFRKKGETQLAAIGGTGITAQSMEAQAACAITSNIAVLSSFYNSQWVKHIHDDGNGPFAPDESGSSYQYEIAGGYYKVINKTISYETYLGFSRGQNKNFYGTSFNSGINQSLVYAETRESNQVFKPFAQFNIGKRTPFADIIFSGRLCLLETFQLRREYSYPDWIDKEDKDYFKNHSNSPNASWLLVEPGITVRLGYEPVKFNFHLGFSINPHAYNKDPLIISTGIVIKMFSSTTRNKLKKENLKLSNTYPSRYSFR